MRKFLLTLALSLFIAPAAFGWGQIGHRAVGYIAQQHLSPQAQTRLADILDGHSLAAVSTWMDEIRSDDAYDYTSTWHWVTVPDGMTYAETETNPDGDALGKLNHPRLEVEGFYEGCDDWKSAKAHSSTVKSGSGGSRSCPSM